MTDTAKLVAARSVVRAAYASLFQITDDADVREARDDLIAIVQRLTRRIESAQSVLDIGEQRRAA